MGMLLNGSAAVRGLVRGLGRRVCAGGWGVVLAAALGAGLVPAVASGAMAMPDGESVVGRGADLLMADGEMDRLIMKSGNEITGEILEETESTVKMRVIVAGITTVTTYQKSEILSIERAERSESGDDSEVKTERSDPTRRDRGRDSDDDGDGEEGKRNNAADENAAQIYYVRMSGTFGEDISETVVQSLVKDIDRTFDDKVEVNMGGAIRRVVDEAVRDRHIVVLELDFNFNQFQPGFDQIWRCEEISPLLEAELDAGRRIVFWVRAAPQGAAFLPWISPEIYFRPGGYIGGIGDLESLVEGMQDEEVKEKQISLRIGHAEGRVIKGGRPHLVPVIRAMARMDYWLAVRFVGGEPQFLNHAPRAADGPGWTILSDDGEGDNADDEDSLVINDILNLDAEWAQRLGLSEGTISGMGDMARALGVGDNYKVLEDARGQRIYNDWREEVNRAWRLAKPTQQRFQGDRPLGEKWEDLARVEGGDVRAIGQRIRILREIKSIVARYAEFMDRGGQFRTQIQNQIDELTLQIQLMRRRG
ncbi:MAG: hypothetical protein ACTS3F_09310 [Phycisphaerales bacterium]